MPLTPISIDRNAAQLNELVENWTRLPEHTRKTIIVVARAALLLQPDLAARVSRSDGDTTRQPVRLVR